MNLIPILAYHSISDRPADWIAPFTVSSSAFAAQMDAIVEAHASTMTVSELVDAVRQKPRELPDRAVVVTFDDGFADFRDVALPAMLERGIRCTLYATTGYLESATGPADARMLDFASLQELDALGVELGGHSHTHPELDTLSVARARYEVEHCKALLEEQLGKRVRSFAYPHGYSSPVVRKLVRDAGFGSACAVGNALSHPGDDVFRLARIMTRRETRKADVTAWLEGTGAARAPRRERLQTRGWRLYRQIGVRVGIRSEHEV